jgi:hypothetical protein
MYLTILTGKHACVFVFVAYELRLVPHFNRQQLSRRTGGDALRMYGDAAGPARQLVLWKFSILRLGDARQQQGRDDVRRGRVAVRKAVAGQLGRLALFTQLRDPVCAEQARFPGGEKRFLVDFRHIGHLFRRLRRDNGPPA